MPYDVLIRGGSVYDGSGRAGSRADLAVQGGRIAAIAPRISGEASRVIDAEGLAVTPGFIDIKTHSDFTLPINPCAESKLRQGVTTEIVGHCGFSVAPCLPGKVQLLKDYEPHRYPSGARTTVIVNGEIVVDAAVHTGAIPGKVLRRAADGVVR